MVLLAEQIVDAQELPADVHFSLFSPKQIALTFSIVFGVIVYRITTAAALSLNKATRSNVRVTVTATAVIINLVVILILDEIYGAVAKWLTKIGTVSPNLLAVLGPL